MPKYQIQTRLANDEWECTEEFPVFYHTFQEASDELEDFCKDCEYSVHVNFMDDFNRKDWRIFEVLDDASGEKLYECFWGGGYRKDDNKSTLAYHPLEFFSIDNGYEPKDIDNIRNLHIGEGYDLDGVFCQHWIRRIK